MASSKRKKKGRRNLSESESGNEAAVFHGYIITKSFEEVCQTKFSTFSIEKVIASRAIPQNVKLLIEVDSRRQVENSLKWKSFHTTKWKIEHVEGSSQKKALATAQEMTAAQGK